MEVLENVQNVLLSFFHYSKLNLTKAMFYFAEIPSADCHIIIGTPKEIVSLRLLGVFVTNSLKLVVFDDADSVAFSNLVKEQLIAKLPTKCQKLFMSSHVNKLLGIGNVKEAKFLVDKTVWSKHIDNYFVKCNNSGEQTFLVLQALSEEIYGTVIPESILEERHGIRICKKNRKGRYRPFCRTVHYRSMKASWK